jgi:hypothetical protein
MKLYLANVDQNLFCKSFSREHIGFDLGPDCNGVRSRRS